MKFLRYFLVLFILFAPTVVTATPTQYGESGLISVPTADTTERGLFQAAVWLNHSQNNEERFTLMPVSLSMGIGDSWEIYGSYPNVLLNDQNDGSMRGFENVGIKYRFWGEADSSLKAAVSAFLRQTVSDNEDLNGLRDLGSRLILSYRLKNAEIHLNAGYLKVDSPDGEDFDNKTLFGGAIDFPISDRFMPFVEVDGNTNEVVCNNSAFCSKEGERIEITPGVQYYLFPYLSMIGGVGFGLTDTGPDYRVTVGLTFTSGAGRYVKAIPVIPGSRERYAAASVSAEELMPELPLVGKEGVAEGVVPAPPGIPGMEGLEVEKAPPSPVGTPTPVVKPGKKEVVSPGALIGEGEAPPVPAEPPMPILKAMPAEKAPLKPEVPAEPAVAFTPPLPVGEKPVQKKAEAPEAAKPVMPAPKPVEKVPAKPEIPAKVAEAAAEEKGVTVQADVLFDFNKWKLSSHGKKALDEIAGKIKGTEGVVSIRIEGHTDNIGSASYNKKLSYKRANSLKEYLVRRHGVDPDIFVVKGYGEERPVASNKTADGRRKNRRVVIIVFSASANK